MPPARRRDDAPGDGQQNRHSAAFSRWQPRRGPGICLCDRVRLLGVMPLLWIATIGGFVCALVTVFKKEWSPVTAPAYALLEGLALAAFRLSRAPFPRHRDSIGQPDIWHIARSVARVSLRADSGDTEFPAGDCRGDGRNHAVLCAAICAGFLRRSLQFDQRLRAYRDWHSA